MWKYIALILIGLIIGEATGVYIGYTTATKLLTPLIGDKIVLDKPKIKGDNNTMRLTQEFIKEEANKNIKLKKWKNRRKIKRQRK
jgi:hypothetical protein